MTTSATLAFDCHAHVYETVVANGRPRYLPPRPAPLAEWRVHLAAHGIRGGVLVQPSFLGTDNAQILTALAQLPASRFAGVAVVDLSMSSCELGELFAQGVRGLRWNLVEGAPLPELRDQLVRNFLDRSTAVGMHLELHLEGPRLADFLPELSRLCPRLVIDHFGLPATLDPAGDPGFRAIAEVAVSRSLWVKLSAPYRSAANADHARALSDILGPDRLVWGSDWPWTRHETGRDYGRLLSGPANAGLDLTRVNASAKELYGLA